MRQHIQLVLCAAGAAVVTAGAASLYAQAAQGGEPLWAYAYATQPKPGDKAAPQAAPNRNLRPNEDAAEQQKPRTVPGSGAQYSLVDVRDGHNVIDWFPGDHPAMPPIIKNGPASMGAVARGCGSCHLPNAKGRPENAPPAGQPVAYTVQTLRDFAAGMRLSADPRKANTPTMSGLAKAMSEDEIKQAAEYFAAIPWSKWIRVVEADKIPEAKLEQGGMYIIEGKEATEPLGNRIVEAPEDDFQANTVRNPRSGFVAYVPKGSLEKGRQLVLNGGGRTIACGTCHGPTLQGIVNIPAIAGRSPSYMMRQLWDMKVGARKGPMTQLMKPVVANLTQDDLTNIVAFLASMNPPTAATTTSSR
ncbi:MAG: cytochrome C-binding protein [Acidobacteria bacterium]|nr:cytochrome C-binding protein [Acidobacteriota bacterium]